MHINDIIYMIYMIYIYIKNIIYNILYIIYKIYFKYIVYTKYNTKYNIFKNTRSFFENITYIFFLQKSNIYKIYLKVLYINLQILFYGISV